MSKLYVLGMGPGHPSYILPVTTAIIQECDILIGGKRNLQYFEGLGKTLVYIGSDLPKLMDYVKTHWQRKKIAFLLSGDTGFYSMLTLIKQHFQAHEIKVIPGISSFQYLMAKVGEPWEGAYIASLHGRHFEFLEVIRQNKKVILLTDHQHSPQYIAEKLLANGLENRTMIVGENLSYENERILFGKPSEIQGMPQFSMAVVVIKDE